MAEGKVHGGRGGAGNITSKAPPADEETFRTPTLKETHYTTGRGGTGNIVSNDSVENARLAQDVVMPASVAKEPAGIHHTGRGGGGNVVGAEGLEGPEAQRKSRSKSREPKPRAGSGVFDKAKELVGLKK